MVNTTQGHKGAQAVMQGDGNLVVYWHGKAIWSSGTAHHGGAILDMQDDGNLVIYWHGSAMWASKDASASSQGMAIVRLRLRRQACPIASPAAASMGAVRVDSTAADSLCTRSIRGLATASFFRTAPAWITCLVACMSAGQI